MPVGLLSAKSALKGVLAAFGMAAAERSLFEESWSAEREGATTTTSLCCSLSPR